MKSSVAVDSQDHNEEHVEKPLIPGAYLSGTTTETLKEIEGFNTTNRPLIKMQFIKKRREFGQGYKFNEQDASERFTEIKSQPTDPMNHVKTKVVDIGTQGGNLPVKSGTQTTWNRKLNKGLQIDDNEEVEDVIDEDNELLKFLENVYPLMEEALQSNETIDIYQDDFDVLPQTDQQEGQSNDLSNQIKEIKSFSYLNCKGKKISCINFQPTNSNSKSKYIVAESFLENLSFEERVIYQVKSHKSLIVFWDFEDIHSIEPVLVLTSPLEVITFEFNQKDPNIVVGGTMNGQVLLWDLSGTSLSVFSSKKNSKSKQEKNEIQEVPFKIMSALQDPSSVQATNTTEIIRKQVSSHKNPVLSLKWLPSQIEIDRKIFHNLIVNTTGESFQFASISMDGQVCIWDTRFGEKDQKKPTQDISTIQWRANYGIQLYRPEGGGQMGGAQIAFRKSNILNVLSLQDQKTSTFTGTSDEGELFFLDWAIRPTEENAKADMVQLLWQNERSYRPTVGLDVSTFFDDIILTLHDFNFCVWKHHIATPVFESMVMKMAHITCGGFSPFRPGVIIVGKTDGSLDIWDLLDQSHKWTIQYYVVACSLTSLKFHDTLQHIVAVGDIDGTLHLLEFPSTLSRKQGDEEKQNKLQIINLFRSMQEFWDREVKRVEYYTDRFRERDETFKADKQKKDQLEQLELAKESSKHQNEEKKEDEFEMIDRIYNEYCKAYLAEKDGLLEEQKEKDKKSIVVKK